MNVAIIGPGRMGQSIVAQAERRQHRVVARWGSGHGTPQRTDLHGANVAFEFTRPEAAERNVIALLELGLPVVCGTTGWVPGPEVAAALRSGDGALVVAPNFSIGMQIFFRLTAEATRLCAGAALHTPWITERHHRAKRDAPSATALRLAEIVTSLDSRWTRPNLERPVGPMPADQLHVVAVRAGHEPGWHQIGWDGEHDEIILEHRARHREGFALGAVLAAEWLVGRRGRHEFDEVVDDLLGAGARSTDPGDTPRR